jgi:hypothetical protein
MSILFKIETKKNIATAIVRQSLEITEEGLKYSSKGLGGALAHIKIFLPFEQVASLDVIKKLMGIETDLSIVSVSGKTYAVSNVRKAEAEKAIDVFNEFKNKNKSNSKESTLDVADQLLKLSKLKDNGILTQEEFDEQKKKLLS